MPPLLYDAYGHPLVDDEKNFWATPRWARRELQGYFPSRKELEGDFDDRMITKKEVEESFAAMRRADIVHTMVRSRGVAIPAETKLKRDWSGKRITDGPPIVRPDAEWFDVAP